MIEATTAEPGFRHEAFFYADADEFLAGTVPFVQEGLGAGEAILVALPRSNRERLDAALGEDGGRVLFAEMEDLGRNPARIIPAWRDFVDARVLDGVSVRGLGEPLWPGRSGAEVDECERHEALLNLAFGEGPSWSLLCAYDSAGLDDEVLDAALLSHPLLSVDGVATANPDWDDHAAEPFAGVLPAAPFSAFELGFERDTLHALRAAVGLEAAEGGLSEQRAADVVLAGDELAANSVLHGGGKGRAAIWREPGALVVEVRDAGQITQPLAGRVRPTPTQENGRGLWVANQLCDLVQIRSGPGGTSTRLWMNLD